MFTLKWKRFKSFLDLREVFRSKPCIYLQTDPEEKIIRVGESADLYERYKGGTAFAVEAAMHGSGNLFFAAEAPEEKNERKPLEATMIYDLQPPYCNQHKKYALLSPVKYVHEGDIPKGLQL
jgi:hypothetical protein